MFAATCSFPPCDFANKGYQFIRHLHMLGFRGVIIGSVAEITGLRREIKAVNILYTSCRKCSIHIVNRRHMHPACLSGEHRTGEHHYLGLGVQTS